MRVATAVRGLPDQSVAAKPPAFALMRPAPAGSIALKPDMVTRGPAGLPIWSGSVSSAGCEMPAAGSSVAGACSGGVKPRGGAEAGPGVSGSAARAQDAERQKRAAPRKTLTREPFIWQNLFHLVLLRR